MKNKTKKFILLIMTILMAVLGFLEQFFLLVLAICIHKGAYIFFDYILKSKKIHTLKNKALTLWAGIIISIVIYFILQLSNINGENFKYFKNLNLLLVLINILPIYPFPGGKLFLYWFGKRFGYLSSSSVLIITSKIIAFIFIIVSFLLYTLFPFNLWLYLLGIYFYKYNYKKLENQLITEIYINLLEENNSYEKEIVEQIFI